MNNENLPKNIDEYIAMLPANQQVMLENLRQIIKQNAPEAEEVISYAMPAFKYKGILVYFAGFQKHCSFFPGNASMIQSLESELKGFKTSKGTIQFTEDNPLPDELVAKIVRMRVEQNDAKALAKKKK